MAKKGCFSAQSAAGQYPFDSFSRKHLRALTEALRFAWSELLAAPKPHGINDMHDVGEVSISEALLRVLCGVHEAEPHPLPVFSDDFETPTSDGSLRNYDRSKLITRVDFCFRLKVNPYPGRSKLYNGIFVEAKLISDGALGPYASQGLIKFLRGDYAWAMPQGMMIAYVLPTNQILPDALAAYFERFGNAEKYGLQTPPRTWPLDRHQPRPCTTTHTRTWQYPPPHNNASGNIEIIHLWLQIK